MFQIYKPHKNYLYSLIYSIKMAFCKSVIFKSVIFKSVIFKSVFCKINCVDIETIN